MLGKSELIPMLDVCEFKLITVAMMNKRLISIIVILSSIACSAECQVEEAANVFLANRFRAGSPIRIVCRSIAVEKIEETSARSEMSENLIWYEFDAMSPGTWRCDVVIPKNTGRGGKWISIISRNGRRIRCGTELDTEETKEFMHQPFDMSFAKKAVHVSTVVGSSLGPEHLDRWFGIHPGGIVITQLPVKPNFYSKIIPDGENKPPQVGFGIENYEAKIDTGTGVMYSAVLRDKIAGNPVEIVNAKSGRRLCNAMLFGIPDYIEITSTLATGVEVKTNVSIVKDKTRLLTLEEFEYRINPNLQENCYLTNFTSGQATRVRASDAPLRVWDYEKMFTPERKAKGLIDYIKKAQE